MSNESNNDKEPVKRFALSPMRVIDWIDKQPSETFRRVCHGLLVLAIAFTIHQIYVSWPLVTSALAGGSESLKKLLQSQVPFWVSVLTGLMVFAGTWLYHARSAKNRIKNLKMSDDSESIPEIPNLVVTTSFVVQGELGFRAILAVKVMNVGNTNLFVEKVTVLLDRTVSNPLTDMGYSAETLVSELRASQFTTPVIIQANGGTHIWSLPFDKEPNFQTVKRNGDRFAKGYIEYTDGSKSPFEAELNLDWNTLEKFQAKHPAPLGVSAESELKQGIPVGHKCTKCGCIFLSDIPPTAGSVHGSKFVTCPNPTCGTRGEIVW